MEQIPADLVLRQFCRNSFWFSWLLILDCLFSSQAIVRYNKESEIFIRHAPSLLPFKCLRMKNTNWRVFAAKQ